MKMCSVASGCRLACMTLVCIVPAWIPPADETPDEQDANEIDDPLGFAAALDGPHEDVSLEGIPPCCPSLARHTLAKCGHSTELIGLSGPLTNLFENLFWTLLILATFVVAFALLPYMVGHTARDIALLLISPAPATPPPSPPAPNVSSMAAFLLVCGPLNSSFDCMTVGVWTCAQRRVPRSCEQSSCSSQDCVAPPPIGYRVWCRTHSRASDAVA